MPDPSPAVPIIIQGPAVLTHNGNTYYAQGAVTANLTRNPFTVQSAYGPIDERMVSSQYEIGFTPVGMIEATDAAFKAKYYPYLGTKFGRSVFPTVAEPLGGTGSSVLTVYSLAEDIAYKFNRAAITKQPNLQLAPNRTIFGAMAFTSTGKVSTLPTDSTFLKTITDPSGGGGSPPGFGTEFEEDEITSDIYYLEIVGRSSPYDKLGSLDGFEIEVALETKQIIPVDTGVPEIYVAGQRLSVTFAPDNLTQAQIDTLLLLQGTGAMFPGQSFSKNKESVIVWGSGVPNSFKITIPKCGARESSHTFEVGTHQHTKLMFTQMWSFTTGVAQDLFTYTKLA